MIIDVERNVPVLDRGCLTPVVGPALTETRFPARATATGWPATRHDREQAFERLTCRPFLLDCEGGQKRRRQGLAALLDWLAVALVAPVSEPAQLSLDDAQAPEPMLDPDDHGRLQDQSLTRSPGTV